MTGNTPKAHHIFLLPPEQRKNRTGKNGNTAKKTVKYKTDKT
jgi:hypothetical protein